MDGLTDWRGRRVVVTGGTGFIGRHVVAQGLEAGVEVHILTSRPDGGARPCGTWLAQADLRDSEAVARVLHQIQPDGVLHLAAAGVVGAPRFHELLGVNVVGLATLLEAVEQVASGVPVVVAGSGAEYAAQDRPIREDDPLGPTTAYAASKAAATAVAYYYATRMRVTLLRLFGVYGEGEREPRLAPYVIARARTGLPVELTGCEQVRDFVEVRDTAAAFWRTLAVPQAPGSIRVLNVGTGAAVRLRWFVETLAELLAERGAAPRLLFGARPYRSDEPMMYVADIGRLQSAVGWRPTTPLVVGLRRMVDAAW